MTMQRMVRLSLVALAIAGLSHSALAQDDSGDGPRSIFDLDLKGSLGEGRHSRYVPPITNFIYNETPYITTELKPSYSYHRLSNRFVTDGGHIHVAALQARVALSERLAFIATKDGYTWARFDDVLDDTSGFNNIAAGLKYNFYSDYETESLFTAGLRYEHPIEDLETNGIELAGNGSGFLNPFITGSTTFGDFGLQTSFGGNFALDTQEDTSFVHYSVHADYELLPGFFPLIEFNGWTAFDRGNRSQGALARLDGADVFNFGSTDRATTVTMAGGFRYRVTDHILVGLAYQRGIETRDDSAFGQRITTDLVLHY